MLVFEAKLEGTQQQYQRLDEAIRTARFVRNSCLRYWLDNLGIGKYELSAYCAVLALEFPWLLNSTRKRVRLLQKELGLQLRGSTTTAKKANQGKKAFRALRNIRPTALLNIKQQVINCRSIDVLSLSLMVLKPEALNCGELATYTSIN